MKTALLRRNSYTRIGLGLLVAGIIFFYASFFVLHTIEEFTKSHPATIALSSTTKRIPAPATILLISQFNHDAEVIRVISEKLSSGRYNTVPVEVACAAIPR